MVDDVEPHIPLVCGVYHMNDNVHVHVVPEYKEEWTCQIYDFRKIFPRSVEKIGFQSCGKMVLKPQHYILSDSPAELWKESSS